jgi:hypothetical protein
MAWVDKEWIAAWGENRPLIANDSYKGVMPELPEHHTWVITRHLEGEPGKLFPKIRVGLFFEGNGDKDCRNIDFGKVDVKIYGDGAAVIELAKNIRHRNGLDPAPPQLEENATSDKLKV